ncbi:uromodulin-like [Hyla sarda]|uniref:uromodulin-like n=1 Tax=Hyla sarda TaxID=327740 RepID=UPI0024C25E9D|nr:uromodulin-like [Hyla sarda]
MNRGRTQDYWAMLATLISQKRLHIVSTSEVLLSPDRDQCDRAGVCPKIECGTLEIKITLLVNELQAMNVDIENIHLLDRKCRGLLNNGGILSITMKTQEGVCGTVLTTSETEATYRNTVFLPPNPAAIIVREILNINVVCTYPL